MKNFKTKPTTISEYIKASLAGAQNKLHELQDILKEIDRIQRTKKKISENIKNNKPIEALIEILYISIELLSLPKNDYSWSSWKNQEVALKEINNLIKKIKAGIIPERIDVAILFVATGPMQEVSLSSGWGDAFIKVAEIYDKVEKLIWEGVDINNSLTINSN